MTSFDVISRSMSLNLKESSNPVEKSIPLSQNQSTFQPERIEPQELENAALGARQRAISARQLTSSWKLQSLYEIGGWKSLFEEYTSQPLDPNTTSKVSMKQVADSATLPLCPSGRPEMGDSVVLGVVGGTVEAPRIAYLTESVPVTEEILASCAPVKPTEIFRMASPCMGDACQHFDGTDCRLAMRIVQQLPTVVETLPACQIRPNCRWWQQEGKVACFRCPQLVTENHYSSEIMQQVAAPNS